MFLSKNRLLNGKQRILFISIVLFSAGALSWTFRPFSAIVTNSENTAPASASAISVENPEKETKEARNAGREDYFFTLLRDPQTNEIPPFIRDKELDFAETLPTKEGLSKERPGQITNLLNWVEAGPNDVGGRTRALGIDARNSQIVIAAGVSGGIWRSIDAGASWSKRTARDINLSITSLTQDPINQDTWYASMGEYSGSSARARGGNASYFGSGLYKSTDNGVTWNFIQKASAQFPVGWQASNFYAFTSKIKVSAADGKLYLATNALGLHVSSNGGVSFEPLIGTQQNGHRWTDFDFSSDGKMAVSLSNGFVAQSQMTQAAGIYVRMSPTSAFTSITPVDFPATAERTVLAFAPSDPNVFYTLSYLGTEEEIDLLLLYKFSYNGSTWTSENRSGNLPNFSSLSPAGKLNAQGGYNMVIAVKPDDPNFVIFGLTNLYRSRDGFATKAADNTTGKNAGWIGGYSKTTTSYGQYTNHHPDQHAIAFDPSNPLRMWSGHDGGLSLTNDVTAASVSWTSKNNGYNVTQFYTVAIPNSSSNNNIVGGTQDNGSPYFSFSGTTTGESQDVSSGDGSYAHFGPRFLYVSTQNGNVSQYNFSTQAWANVKPTASTGQLFIHPFDVNPNDDRQMVYPSGRIIWYNANLSVTDKQIGWVQTTIPTEDLAEGYRLSSVRFASGLRTYLGAFKTDAEPKLIVFNTNVNPPTYEIKAITGAAVGAYPHDIAVNPFNDKELLIVLSNYSISGIFHSADAGDSFSLVEGNLTGNSDLPGPSIRSASIVPAPWGKNEYYVGTSIGLYSTSSLAGENTVWVREGSSSIGTSIVAALASRTADGRIVAATHGRGIFVSNINTSTSSEEQNRMAGFELVQNYPNPFNPSTTLAFNLPETGMVSLDIFDVNGRKIASPVNEIRPAGRHEIRFDASGLSNGVYLYKLTGKWGVLTKKMTVMK